MAESTSTTAIPGRFYEQWRQRLHDNSQLHPNGQCIVWTGCTSRGYGQFRYKEPMELWPVRYNTKAAHRMAMICKLRDLDIPASQHASHLCNRKLCVNTEHLVLEPGRVNSQRHLCFRTGRCNGHVYGGGERARDCLVLIAEPEPGPAAT